MSILNWFNKPKWQSPNEQVRMTAVQNSDDAQLLQALTEIVNNDVSEKVQKAALNRIKDPSELIQILIKHTNKELRKAASKKLIHWFSENTDDSQENLMNQIKDATTIRALAATAKNSAVRKIALAQIKQQGLLSDLLFNESDFKLQALIVNQIESPKTLETLQKKAKKSHHKLYKLLTDKLAENKPINYQEEALDLCQQLENVVHGKTKDLQLDWVEKEWLKSEPHVDEPTKLRFTGAFAAAKMILDPEHRMQFLAQQKRQRSAALLNELEQVVQKNQSANLKQVQAQLQKYQGLSTEDFNQSDYPRYQTAMAALLAHRDEIQQAEQIPAKATGLLDELNKQLSQQIVQPGQLTKLKQQWQKAIKNVKPSESLNTIKNQFSEGLLKLADKIEQSAQLRTQAAEQAVALIEPTVAQIKEGHLVKAKQMTNKIAAHKKTAGFNHPIIKQNKYQLDSVWQQLKDLRNWQKWSNDKARQDIIEELKAMIGKAQHPDAVLKKLKEVNERWYALEDMEKLPGDKYPSRNAKMWQEFREISKVLFEPTQPFFEKRSEQQESYQQNIEQHINDMRAVDLNDTSERDLARMSRTAIKHLKSLDQLPPKKRGQMAKKLRQEINRIDKKLNEFYSMAENKKLQLIEAAIALQDNEDHHAAIEAAKTLQQQWKTAGIVKQNTERKLWKKFRQANDVIFNRRAQENKQQQAELQAQRTAAQEVLNTYQNKLKKSQSKELLTGLKSELLKSWSALDKPANLLASELQNLLKSIDDKVKTIAAKDIIELHKKKQMVDQVLTDYESDTITSEKKDETIKKWMNDELENFFSKRATQDESLNTLLIQAEFLSGLASPEEHLDERMAYQVKVLSERMSGEKTQNNSQQAETWLEQWYLSTKTDAAFIKKNKKRINQVLKAMTQLLID